MPEIRGEQPTNTCPPSRELGALEERLEGLHEGCRNAREISSEKRTSEREGESFIARYDEGKMKLWLRRDGLAIG